MNKGRRGMRFKMKYYTPWFVLAVAIELVWPGAGQAAPEGSAKGGVLPVTKDLVCWYDAAVGVTTGSNGVIQTWADLSGNNHYGTRASGAPVLALNQVNSRPAVQFRTASGACGFNVDGPFFVEQQYLVVRSPHDKWNNDGCFLGRRWGRSSCYRLGRNSSGFWQDQFPEAVSKNGKKLRDRPFDMAPITEYMVLKIDVNDGDMSRNTYQIGIGDLASCDFDVAEIIGYASSLSSNEEAAVGLYLATKYGISTSYAAPSSGVPLSVPVVPRVSAKSSSQAVTDTKPALLVTNGLVCWFDASSGITTGSNGVVQTWNDLSGNAHHATPGGSAPALALNQINSKPVVQFRNNWLALAGTFFAKEHYIVLRSPVDKWSGPGSFLGRLKGRGSSYNTWAGDTGFWTDQSPVAVTRNGTVLPGIGFDCSPITNYMVLKIDVNDHSTNAASYAIGNNDGMAGCNFDVAEILGYQSMLSPLEEESVGAYLAAKYGISTAYRPLPRTGGGPVTPASVQYKRWQHSGSLFLLTTPEGANLEASASEDNFPVLVRLSKDWFNFSEAKGGGADIRFATAADIPLAFQIDEWDAAAGTALIWVRVPLIKGNARQELKMYWGKADAASESSGPAVFNRSNGYLSVWHMNDTVKDDAGTLDSTDVDTSSSSGMIGMSRHFSGGKGISCGNKITTYPFASSPHTSEAWFKGEKLNKPILVWGKHDMVNLQFLSTPPHVAAGGVHGTSVLQKSGWFHVVYTYNGQSGQIYVNGQSDVPAPVPDQMDILTPVSLGIGGGFIGDIDEVRVSRWARSSNWVKLQYENQKPLQMLVGPLVQSGKGFSVSEKKITLLEGKSIVIKGRAGGAMKVYWIVKSGGVETIAAVDQFNFTVEAGRVTGDQTYTLQFKAVYPDGVKTQDIPVTVREDIPDPVFTLKAPAKWDGRETVEVVPQIDNLPAMQAKHAGELKYEWTVTPMVEAKEIVSGKLILKRARNSGTMPVTVAVSNGGKPVAQTMQIVVREPAKDAWVQRIPGKDEKPLNNQFYARDDKNEGTLYYNGILSNAADTVFLKVYADDKLVKTESQKLTADKAYAFSAKLKPGLIKYKVEFGSKNGDAETILQTVTNLVCGDAYLINGQSNALAVDWGPGEHPDTSEWIRSFGDNGGDTISGWGNAVRRQGGHWQIGCWGMDLAKLLVDKEKIPICIMNGAVGGTLIEAHTRNLTNSVEKASIYGRLLNRIEKAGLTHGIRGAFWHQGECNQSNWGETGGYGWESYETLFLEIAAAWKQDYPNIQHYYLFQIWPNSCSIGGNRHSDKLRDVQRILPRLFSNMTPISTLGIKPEGPCHFPPAGYAELARQLLPVVEQYNYGKEPAKPVTAADLKKAYYTSASKDEIALEFDQPMVWSDALASQFYLDGKEGRVAAGDASGKVIKLKLASAETAKTISYLADRKWDSKNLLNGQNGIAALTFFEVPLDF